MPPSSILQSLRSSLSSEDKPDREGNGEALIASKPPAVSSLERKNEQLFCVGLHPRNDKILSFLISETEDGSSWIAVLSQYNSSKHSISPNSSGNFSNLEQPDRITAFKPFNLQILLGRLARCLQDACNCLHLLTSDVVHLFSLNLRYCYPLESKAVLKFRICNVTDSKLDFALYIECLLDQLLTSYVVVFCLRMEANNLFASQEEEEQAKESVKTFVGYELDASGFFVRI
nr:uncharacterized protein LOC109148758 [Ipomoea batatas]